MRSPVSQTNGLATTDYAYDPATLALVSETITYSIPGQLTFTRTLHRSRDVLLTKENKAGTTTFSRYTYTVNAMGQRTNVSQTGTAFGAPTGWNWGYDSLGQVTTAEHATTPANHRAYQFDTIGNRQRVAAGTLDATDPSATAYAANALNQSTAVNTVNPVHDPDGNATAYPLPTTPTANSTLTWDAENRLLQTQVASGGPVVQALYDAQSRRIAETVGTTTTLFIYDGWNVISEYQLSNLQSPISLSKSHLWGLDISGTLEGAGGVGGLLAIEHAVGSSTSWSIRHAHADANGNILCLTDSSGNASARYRYGPFGELLQATDLDSSGWAARNIHGFSSKPLDSTMGLHYYAYRWYDSPTGGWTSKEPLEEFGSINMNSFIFNNPMSDYDILGLCSGGRKALLDAACKANEDSKDGRERCAAICCKNGIYTQTKWNTGSRVSCFSPSCPPGEQKIRDIYSHPEVDASPSPGDKRHAGSGGADDFWIVTNAPRLSNPNQNEVWIVKYNKNGSLGGWLYDCKTGKFRERP